jgi:uncharacterized membrane protein YbhN (UPF0104 family)
VPGGEPGGVRRRRIPPRKPTARRGRFGSVAEEVSSLWLGATGRIGPLRIDLDDLELLAPRTISASGLGSLLSWNSYRLRTTNWHAQHLPGRSMPGIVTQRLGATLSLAVFGLALWALHHNLRDYGARDVLGEITVRPLSATALTVGLTAASYVLLTGYDVLALRHVGRRLPYARIALASFISYGFSHNVGLSLLSAGSVRYRIYSAVGLSAAETVSVTMICALTFGLGATLAAGLILLAEPPPAIARPIGALCLLAVAGYLAWTATRRTPIRLWQWSFKAPSMGRSLSQIGLAVASTVLYALLSIQAQVPFPVFASVYALAIFAGIMSHVPGGVGVFETVMLLLLPGLPADVLLASMLVYRAVYYLAPLAVGLMLMAAYEAVQHRRPWPAPPPASAVFSPGRPRPGATGRGRLFLLFLLVKWKAGGEGIFQGLRDRFADTPDLFHHLLGNLLGLF